MSQTNQNRLGASICLLICASVCYKIIATDISSKKQHPNCEHYGLELKESVYDTKTKRILMVCE